MNGKMRIPSNRIVAIHVLAVLLGAGAGLLTRSAPQPAGGAEVKTKRGERGALQGVSGDTLLDAVIQAASQTPEGAAIDGVPFDERMDGLWQQAPGGDLKAGFEEAMANAAALLERGELDPREAEDLMLQLAARFAAWLDADPIAALAEMERTGKAADFFNSYGVPRIAMVMVIRKQGLRQAVSWLDKVKPSHVAMYGIADALGKQGDVEEFRWFASNHVALFGPEWSDLAGNVMSSSWPLEKKDDLVNALTGGIRATAIGTLASRMDGMEGIEWLRGLFGSGTLTDAERKTILQSASLRHKINALDVPFDERIALLQEFGVVAGNVDHAVKAQQLIFPRLQDFFQGWGDNGDWLYRFRNGDASAGDARDAALAAFSDPGSGANEFRSQLFRFLAQEDLDRAVGVLDGLDKQQVDWEKAYAARWWFYHVEPARFYELTSSISHQNDPKLRSFLWECWRSHSASDLERYGEGYLEWVRGLPQGQEKQWALEGVELASKGKYPAIHAEVTQLLKSTR